MRPKEHQETEDNKTITSPGPFKAGAFNLAFKLSPKPKLIPIALANFDYPVSKTIYSAVIKEPITISDHVKDPENQDEMKSFLDNYRTKFRSYVEEAIDLAKNVQDNIDKIENLKTNVNLVSPVEEEFELDVRELEHNSFQQTKTNNSVALYGSSTFKMWDNAKNDLSINNLYNLGFGGSTLVSCRRYFDRLVAPLNPSNLFFYAGDNDIGSGMSAEDLENEFLLFASEVNEKARLTEMPDNKSLTLRVDFETTNEDLSPMMDTQNATFVLGRNKSNKPIDDYVADARSNDIDGDPHGAVFVTKGISLAQPATSLKVIIAANRQMMLISESSINCLKQIPLRLIRSLSHSQDMIIFLILMVMDLVMKCLMKQIMMEDLMHLLLLMAMMNFQIINSQ